MKKKISLLIITITSMFCTVGITLAIFNATANYTNEFKAESYEFSIDASGGTFANEKVILNGLSATLPTPYRKGYTFIGYSNSSKGNVIYNENISNVEDINNKKIYAKWNIITYNITYDLNGGTISGQPTSYNVNDTYTLPTPSRKGYTFTGWSGTDISGKSKNVTVSVGIGNKTYTANWNQNYYTVSYYVNGNLWTTRSVGYGNNIENLNAQSQLDNYHTFHGWNNWIDTMPDYNISLTANVTESYCMLMTGHGPYGNATALLKVFQDAGWTGRVEIAPSTTSYYWVVTDYTLTRAEAEVQKEYIASHTNYRNYNYPYLYWVAVSCTNGYSESWTRSSGQRNFN